MAALARAHTKPKARPPSISNNYKRIINLIFGWRRRRRLRLLLTIRPYGCSSAQRRSGRRKGIFLIFNKNENRRTLNLRRVSTRHYGERDEKGTNCVKNGMIKRRAALCPVLAFALELAFKFSGAREWFESLAETRNARRRGTNVEKAESKQRQRRQQKMCWNWSG